MKKIKTQVGIIGAGPAGLTLAHWLKKYGIESVILESRSQHYVEVRVRAGLLEQNTVDVLSLLGLSDRLKKEGQVHKGVIFSFNGKRIRVPFGEFTNGRNITIYGQREVIKDLTGEWIECGKTILFESLAVKIKRIDTPNPEIHFRSREGHGIVSCDFVAACDGSHGLGRKELPKNSYKTFAKTYPFSWLGILAKVAPSSEELIYAYHQNGFALHSLRSKKVSRFYIQVSNDQKIEDWSDDRIWEELALRLGTEDWVLTRGPVMEKSITPMRSYMIDSMQFGRLFLAGDAAHIVPPTGAKGLNLAIADIYQLTKGFAEFYTSGNKDLLNEYSQKCLKRVWRVQEFSHFMTNLFHKKSHHGSFANQLQQSRFEFIGISESFARSIAENYVGIPLESL